VAESIKEYEVREGTRFRRTRNQVQRGLSREEAFQEFVAEGYRKSDQRSVRSIIPDNVWQDPELTLNNFGDKSGGKRFRMTKKQKQAGLTRSQAFEETRKHFQGV
jgi:hypothetical protein